MFDQDVNERTVKRVRFSNCVNANDVTYLAIGTFLTNKIQTADLCS